jgi:carbon-monoxide dehydrogenase large subunit
MNATSIDTTSMERYGVGQPVRRREDRRFLTGTGRYIDDVSMPHMAHLFILRSIHAHALIESIEARAAAAAPGVLAVLTGADWVADGLRHPDAHPGEEQ